MKLLLSVLFVFASFSSFAGPEDRVRVCYARETQSASLHIPTHICLESLTIDFDTQKVHVENYFDQSLLNGLTLKSVSRHNEDRLHFTASKVLFSSWDSGCGAGEEIEVHISGTTDFDGFISPTNLTVSTTQKVTYNTCHSRPQVQKFSYKLQ